MQKGLKIWALIGVVLVAAGGFYAYNEFLTEKHNGESHVTQPEVSAGNTRSSQEEKAKQAEKDVFDVADINSGMVGKTVKVRCKISNVNKPKDTTFFKIKDIANNKSVNGVMFNKTNKDNTDRKAVLEHSASTDAIIYVEGEVAEYKNALELKAWKVYTN